MKRILYVHPPQGLVHRARPRAAGRAVGGGRLVPTRPLGEPARRSPPPLRRCDAVVGWWASWHTFWPFTLAPLLGTPSLLIVGGFDIADERGDRVRLSAGRRPQAPEPLDHPARDAPDDELRVQPRRVPAQRRDPAPAARRRPSRRAGPVRVAARRAARASRGDGRQRRHRQPRAQGPAGVRRGGGAACPTSSSWSSASGSTRPPTASPPWRARTCASPASSPTRSCSTSTPARRSTSRPPSTRASASRSPRRCSAGASRWRRAAGRCPRWSATPASCWRRGRRPAVADGIRTALALGPGAPGRARERVLSEFPVEVRRRGLHREVERLLDVAGGG